MNLLQIGAEIGEDGYADTIWWVFHKG